MDSRSKSGKIAFDAKLSLTGLNLVAGRSVMPAEKTIAEQCRELAAAWRAGTYEWWPSEDRVVWSPELLQLY